MADIPNGMMTHARQPISYFHNDELLYYRFHFDHWEEGGVAVIAIDHYPYHPNLYNTIGYLTKEHLSDRTC